MGFQQKIQKLFFKRRSTMMIYKGVQFLFTKGPRFVWDKIKFIVSQQYRLHKIQPYRITAEEIQKQQNTKFAKPLKFSILVPLYNTPEKYLREMILSVVGQTYSDWELCLADASDEAHTYVEKVCCEYAKKDSRIRYQKLNENKGISDNTNAAIAMACGDYISLLDHDDLLHRSALYYNRKAIEEQGADFMYTDEVTFEKNPYKLITTHYKPDFAIDNLRANNYICHFSTFKRELLDAAGWFRNDCDGSQDYDMILRLTEKAQKIVHIPKVLYFWRSHPGSVASDISVKPYCLAAARRALDDHLQRMGLKGKAVNAPKLPSIYKINYEIEGNPLISIIIPNKDHLQELKTCVSSVIEKSSYTNYEILIVENGSTNDAVLDYYEQLKERPNVRILQWNQEFNYSAINNFAVKQAAGDYLLFLNNDTEVISENWIEEMLMFAQRKDVGAVGAKLYFKDGSVQHAGIILGLGGAAGHSHYAVPKDNLGYMGRLYYAQNYTAVTAACMMVSKEKFNLAGGFDENLKIALNDVDFCLKLREKEFVNVFTPFAELYHYESKSRGNDNLGENKQRFEQETALFKERWKAQLEAGDPYYNPNLSLENQNFSLKI